MPIDVTFRDEVQPTDRDIVRSIVERTGFFLPDELDVAVELVDERLTRGDASGYFFVFAEVDSIIAGYACYGPTPCTIGSYDLYWIAVDPQSQRHGIGRKLAAEVERRIAAASGRRIYIDTSGKAQYEPTRAFYEGCGYECEARLVDFYAPGDDRLIYTKILSLAPS